jgi:hypothetical protein
MPLGAPDFAIILTGGQVGATAIAAIIELVKKLVPGLGDASPVAYQRLAAVLALGLVAYAAWALAVSINPGSLAALAVAWFSIARLATATYDTVKAAVNGAGD